MILVLDTYNQDVGNIPVICMETTSAMSLRVIVEVVGTSMMWNVDHPSVQKCCKSERIPDKRAASECANPNEEAITPFTMSM